MLIVKAHLAHFEGNTFYLSTSIVDGIKVNTRDLNLNWYANIRLFKLTILSYGILGCI